MPMTRRVSMSEPVAIAGLAQSRQGDHSDVPQAYLWWDIVEQACADAGLTLDDIDAVVGEGPAGIGLRGHMPGAGIAEQLGRPLRFHARSETGAASTLSGMSLAAHAISTGLAEVAVIATAAAGREGGYASADRQAAIAHMAKLSGPYEYPYGTTRVSDYAVYAMRHAYEHGTTSAQLAEVAVAQRHAATLHPLSINGWRGEITVDDVLGSPLIADPLHLLDCCVVNQGAGAIVMTRADDARAAGHHQPVLLLGYGESMAAPCSSTGGGGRRLAAPPSRAPTRPRASGSGSSPTLLVTTPRRPWRRLLRLRPHGPRRLCTSGRRSCTRPTA